MSNVGVGGSLELACSKTHEHILRVPHIILILRRRRCRLLFLLLLLLLLLLTEKVCMSPAFALLLQQTNIRHTSPKARNRRRENTSDEAKLRALDFDQRQCELRAHPRLRQALQNPLSGKHICWTKMPLLRLAKHHKFLSTEHHKWWWSPPRQR